MHPFRTGLTSGAGMRRKLNTTAGYLSWPASAAPCVVPIDAPPPSCWRLSFLARTTPSTRSWAPAVPVGLSRSTSAASGRPPQPGLLGPGEADGTRAGVRRHAAAPAPPKAVGLERARSDRGRARPAPWWRRCGQRRTSHPRSLRPPAGERPGTRPCRHDAPPELRSLKAIPLATVERVREDMSELVVYDGPLAEVARQLGYRVLSPS